MQDSFRSPKYDDIVENLPLAIHKHHPEFRISSTHLIQTAILKCSSEDGKYNYRKLVNFVKVCNEECGALLLSTFESSLDKRFDGHLYQELLLNADYDPNNKGYFRLYSEFINSRKGGRAFKVGKQKLTDIVFINYALIVHHFKLFDRPELNILQNLNEYESWLLNPANYDYSKFDAMWLQEFNKVTILENVKGNNSIAEVLDQELTRSFDPSLAELKYKYFYRAVEQN